MKRTLFLFMIISCYKAYSQGAAGFFDDRRFFYTYMNGHISRQEIMPIDTFYPSLHYVSYIDRNGNFKLIVNHKKYVIFPIRPDKLQVSNYLMAYTQGLQLGVFNGKVSKKIETFTRNEFKLGDSILAYIDNYDVLKVYIYDTVYSLMNFSSADRYMVSDNMVIYKTLDEKLKVFYNQSIYDVEEVYPSSIKKGKNVVAYMDYLDNFKVFDRGNKFTLETYPIEDFEVSNDIVTYSNNVNEWIAYSAGQKISLLSTSPRMKEQKRNILVYADNAGNFFMLYRGKKVQLENYTPLKFEIWDDLLVYEDVYRVLWGVYRGEKIKISRGIVKGEWQLQKRAVVYWDLTPSIKMVWDNGNTYEYSEEEDPSKK